MLQLQTHLSIRHDSCFANPQVVAERFLLEVPPFSIPSVLCCPQYRLIVTLLCGCHLIQADLYNASLPAGSIPCPACTCGLPLLSPEGRYSCPWAQWRTQKTRDGLGSSRPPWLMSRGLGSTLTPMPGLQKPFKGMQCPAQPLR